MEKIEKEKKFIFPKKITTIFTYEYLIEQAFRILKDFKISSPFFSEMRSDITMKKGKNSYEIGNEFTLVWYFQTILNFTVHEIVEEINYKKIHWRVFAEQWRISYSYIYEVHSNTVQENTLLIFSLIYDDPESLPFTKITLRDYHRIVLDSCKFYKNCMDDFYKVKEQTESIIIKCERKRIWQILINLNKLYQFNKQNTYEFLYEGEYLEENMLIKMKDDKDFIETFTVKNIVNSHAEEKWGYELENYEEAKDDKTIADCSSKLPKQQVIISMIEVSENRNFLIIKHVLKAKVKKKDFQKLSKEKVKILNSLKNFLENESGDIQ